jgi:hypothetical protein
MAKVARADWTLTLACTWHCNFEFSNLIFIKEAQVWFWIYDLAWNVKGGAWLASAGWAGWNVLRCKYHE